MHWIFNQFDILSVRWNKYNSYLSNLCYFDLQPKYIGPLNELSNLIILKMNILTYIFQGNI